MREGFASDNGLLAEAPLWLLAAKQTAGIGRRGNHWLHRAGNFAGNLLLPWKAGEPQAAPASYAVALCLADSFVEFGIERQDISLKWPNDVLIKGEKICGILLEWLEGKEGNGLSIGIGINLASSPREENFSATSLGDHFDTPPTPRQILLTLDEKLDHWIGRYKSEGFAPIREKWLEQAHGLGDMASIATPSRTLKGRINGLGPQGELRLETDEGEMLITAGEVFFGED